MSAGGRRAADAEREALIGATSVQEHRDADRGLAAATPISAKGQGAVYDARLPAGKVVKGRKPSVEGLKSKTATAHEQAPGQEARDSNRAAPHTAPAAAAVPSAASQVVARAPAQRASAMATAAAAPRVAGT